MAEEVEKVILTVYEIPGNEKSRREAITWLQDFTKRSEAWNVAFHLLGSKSNQVQFFASNMIRSKVEKEWHEQTEAVKQDIHSRVLQIIKSYVQDGNNGMSQNALQRLCLILCDITIHTPQTVELFISETTQFLLFGLEDSSGKGSLETPLGSELVRDRALYVATELLRVLPEEKDAKSSSNHALIAGLDPEGIEQRMNACTAQVLEAILKLIQLDKPLFQSRAFDCLNSWASSAVNLVALARFRLLGPTLSAINASGDLDTIEAASRALMTCVKQDTYEKTLGEPEGEEMVRALDQVVEGVLACGPILAASNDPNNGLDFDADRVAVAICKLAVGVAERQLDRVIVGETPQLLQLVDTIMGLTAHRFRNVSVHSLNFWLLVQDYSLHERHESLREPCYFKLLEVLLRQCTLHTDAATGDPQDIDDDIASFRENHDGVKEPLIVTYFVLGQRYVQTLYEVLCSSTEWTIFEAALFALTAASSSIVEHALSSNAGPQSAAIRQVILDIFANMGSLQLFVANGATLRSGAAFVGAFAKVLARADRVVIERSLEYLSLAMGFSNPVSEIAGTSFQQVCSASRLELAMHPEGVQMLVQRIETVFQNFPSHRTSFQTEVTSNPSLLTVPMKARVEFVQGVTRVASCMKVEQCTATLAVLLNPVLERLGRAVEQVEPNAVVVELEVLNASIKFVVLSQELDSPALHPVSSILQGTLPILERIYAIEALQVNSEVVNSLYSLISTSFVSAKDVLAPHLESLLNAAVRQFLTTWSPCCITCIGKAVEIFGPSPQYHGGFIHLFAKMVDAMVIAVRDGHASGSPAIVSEFFDAALVFLVFCPAALFSWAPLEQSQVPVMLAVLQITTQCLAFKESEALRSVLNLLSSTIKKVASPRKKTEEWKAILDRALAEEGQAIVGRLLVGIAGYLNSAQSPKLAQALADMLYSYGGIVQAGAYQCMVSSPDQFTAITDANKELFVSLLPKVAVSLSKSKELFSNFGDACRQECTQPAFQHFMVEAEKAIASMASNPPFPPGAELIELC